MQTHELHLDIINDKLCSRKKKINYQAYINNITQKKRDLNSFLFTTVYTELSREYAHSKQFSNKSFQHSLGHTKHQNKKWI